MVHYDRFGLSGHCASQKQRFLFHTIIIMYLLTIVVWSCCSHSLTLRQQPESEEKRRSVEGGHLEAWNDIWS